MDDVLLKRFEKPDEIRRFEKGKYEVVTLGGMTVGRATYEPGWKWSVHVGPLSGASLCEVEHVGLVVSGHAKVLMRDGREFDIRAGDFFYVAPGMTVGWWETSRIRRCTFMAWSNTRKNGRNNLQDNSGARFG